MDIAGRAILPLTNFTLLTCCPRYVTQKERKKQSVKMLTGTKQAPASTWLVSRRDANHRSYDDGDHDGDHDGVMSLDDRCIRRGVEYLIENRLDNSLEMLDKV